MEGLGYQLDYSGLPEHLRPGLKAYIEQRVPPGGFIRAVLENDLLRASGQADHINRHLLPEITQWVYMEAPQACWGTPEKVSEWLGEAQAPDPVCSVRGCPSTEAPFTWDTFGGKKLNFCDDHVPRFGYQQTEEVVTAVLEVLHSYTQGVALETITHHVQEWLEKEEN